MPKPCICDNDHHYHQTRDVADCVICDCPYIPHAHPHADPNSSPDSYAMAMIADALRGEWSPDTLDRIAEIVRISGRIVPDSASDPDSRFSHSCLMPLDEGGYCTSVDCQWCGKVPPP